MAEMQAALGEATALKTASAYYSASNRAIKSVEQLSTPRGEEMLGGGGTRRNNRSGSDLDSEGAQEGVRPLIDPAVAASSLNVHTLRALITQLGHRAPSRTSRRELEAQLSAIRGEMAEFDRSGGGGSRGGGGNRGRGRGAVAVVVAMAAAVAVV